MDLGESRGGVVCQTRRGRNSTAALTRSGFPADFQRIRSEFTGLFQLFSPAYMYTRHVDGYAPTSSALWSKFNFCPRTHAEREREEREREVFIARNNRARADASCTFHDSPPPQSRLFMARLFAHAFLCFLHPPFPPAPRFFLRN